VALSPGVSALTPLAVEIVLIAFRVGLHVERTIRNLEIGTTTDAACSSYIVSEKTPDETQAALDEFHRERVSDMRPVQSLMTDTYHKATLKYNHAYISAYGLDTVTISGPPAALNTFLERYTDFAENCSQSPVRGLYHAPHLYGQIDAKRLIRATSPRSPQTLSNYSLALPLLSTSSGQLFDERLQTLDLLVAVVDDILKHSLYFGKVIDGCTRNLGDLTTSKCNIVSFGPKNAEDVISKALISKTDFKVTEHSHANVAKSLNPFGDAPRTSKKPKLAIVGMAGRFPNAADHQKFWDLLEAGLDVHRKVRRSMNTMTTR